jgi:hypothetical protein
MKSFRYSLKQQSSATSVKLVCRDDYGIKPPL